MATTITTPPEPPVVPVDRTRKRLIVFCDGTWEDSTSDNETQYPSNVTRLSRAISPYAIVTDNNGNDESIEQIIYYQKGVGTGTLDRLVGGASGIGVSANVRAAYGFLAHNYQPGDAIYFFGFSRGAYTARAIAGLVTNCGLLTKKGMDSFQILYNKYYKETTGNVKVDLAKQIEFLTKLEKDGLLVAEAREAVEIIGVFDTVGFHQTWITKTATAKLFGINSENIEFHNTKISHRVKYGFHALALDETRRAYSPTLWNTPDVPAGDSNRLEELVQVWFSGNHTDIGGGKFDHRLSDVSLAWMVAQCKKTGLLSFDDTYLISISGGGGGGGDDDPAASKKPWSISQGATQDDRSIFWAIVDGVTRNAPLISLARSPLSESKTNESIHCSITDRKFGANKGADGAKSYACRALSGTCVEKGPVRLWKVGSGGGNAALTETPALSQEEYYKGRIRPARNDSVAGG